MSKIILSKISTDAPAKAEKEKLVKETESLAKQNGEIPNLLAKSTQTGCMGKMPIVVCLRETRLQRFVCCVKQKMKECSQCITRIETEKITH